jgi:hypothetical protein
VDDVRVPRQLLGSAAELEPRHRRARYGGDEWCPSFHVHECEERGHGAPHHKEDLDHRADTVILWQTSLIELKQWQHSELEVIGWLQGRL